MNDVIGYVLKADIRHYFDTINHSILISIIERKIKDRNIIWLIKTILNNHKTPVHGMGMPLGNLTSQFFANVYLGELDLFVKHVLHGRYYIRYVDDFVILHTNKKVLERWKEQIGKFVREKLDIKLHPDKSRVIALKNGVTLLGFRVFDHYRLLKKSNALRIWKRLDKLKQKYDEGEMSREEIMLSLEGWLAYAEFANTYKFRKKVVGKFNEYFSFLE